VGAGAGKWRKYWEKWPGNEKRREQSLSAFWRLVLGLFFPQKNKKLVAQGSNLQPVGERRSDFVRSGLPVDLKLIVPTHQLLKSLVSTVPSATPNTLNGWSTSSSPLTSENSGRGDKDWLALRSSGATRTAV
jgi:hypothetical protein